MVSTFSSKSSLDNSRSTDAAIGLSEKTRTAAEVLNIALDGKRQAYFSCFLAMNRLQQELCSGSNVK